MTEFGLHFYSSPLDQCPRDVGICVMWDHFRILEEVPLTFLACLLFRDGLLSCPVGNSPLTCYTGRQGSVAPRGQMPLPWAHWVQGQRGCRRPAMKEPRKPRKVRVWQRLVSYIRHWRRTTLRGALANHRCPQTLFLFFAIETGTGKAEEGNTQLETAEKQAGAGEQGK